MALLVDRPQCARAVGEESKVSSRFDLADLAVPVVVAPMAGGPSTPELAAAVSDAGGLGFIASGLLSAEAFAKHVVAARKLTSGPVGVNLFVPQRSAGTPAEFERYAAALAGEAEHYGVRLGEPRYDDDAWPAKLDVVHDLRPDVVSFTFGLPTRSQSDRLEIAGITTVVTVTTVEEAEMALARGVAAVVAQGPSAGGHRGTFDPASRPATESLAELLAALAARVDAPVVAAGGLATADDVNRVVAAGAVAAQLGTTFLLADEARHESRASRCTAGPGFTEIVVTRAFSGRSARGLRNRFID
jgi:nitronate monooxygenase